MDRMRERPVAERRKILYISSVVLGLIIFVFGFWNTSNRLLALNNLQSEVVSNSADEGFFTSFKNGLAGVILGFEGGLKDLNNKLGPNE